MLKITNFWENYNELKIKIKEFDNKLYFEIGDYLQNNTPKNTLLFLLNKIQQNNDILNIFDYTENEKIKILSLINDPNNLQLVFNNACLKLTDSIYNNILFKNHIDYNSKNYKITTEEQSLTKIGNTIITIYYCNGIKFLTFTNGSDIYCTIKNGTPSNIRNTRKKATRTSWDITGLKQIFGENVTVGSSRRQGDFNDDWNDTTWGYTGPTKPSLKYIHTKFKECFESTNLI